MEFCYRNKFNNCPHACHALLCTRAELVEGTMDRKWGSGLDVQRTHEYHPNYWPGENHLGRILMTIRKELERDWELQVLDKERSSKRKPSSLVEENSSKRLQ